MRRTVLLIDARENTRFLRACLAEKGDEVLWTTHGEVGVLLADLRQPDLILLDPQVPVLGEPGGAIRYLQESRRTHRIPIYAIRPCPHSADEWEWERVPVDFLDGSVGVPEDLLARVESCFSPSRGDISPAAPTTL